MNEWQTIDTAPKDGTPVLLFGDLIGEIHVQEDGKVCVGSLEYGSWGLLYADCYSVAIEPTHWMPLPSPPVLKAKQMGVGE